MRSLLTGLGLLLVAFQAHAERSIRLGCPEHTPVATVGASILREAYQRIDVDVEFISMPTKRALLQSNAGKTDGEVHRIYQITESYPNLLRVPTAINYTEQVAFLNQSLPSVSSCEDLKDFRVGIVRGVRHAELCTQNIQNLEVYNDNLQMMKVLNAQRLDVAVTARLTGLLLKHQMQLDNIMVHEPSFKRIPLYHYLHKSNADLIGPLNKVLQQMEESGELARLIATAVKMVVEGAYPIENCFY